MIDELEAMEKSSTLIIRRIYKLYNLQQIMISYQRQNILQLHARNIPTATAAISLETAIEPHA